MTAPSAEMLEAAREIADEHLPDILNPYRGTQADMMMKKRRGALAHAIATFADRAAAEMRERAAVCAMDELLSVSDGGAPGIAGDVAAAIRALPPAIPGSVSPTTESEHAKHYDVLRIDPQGKPIYLVREAFAPDDPQTTEYWYDEGTCPVNVLNGRFVEVILDGDTDPHGLLEFVRTIPKPEFLNRGHRPDEEWPKIIPEAFAATSPGPVAAASEGDVEMVARAIAIRLRYEFGSPPSLSTALATKIEDGRLADQIAHEAISAMSGRGAKGADVTEEKKG